ncbi:hypothetical protein EXE41_10235 [Halorubrum sp. SD690R]|uniref:HalOD1 output domain-containing protein n=1 Tax=Halorubrum sp. SD690R TaxID=2518117 RepID=UPI0010F4E0B5|nr:HalOD1 output domain-containing protein [Halorubrum sp. SD690R]TKX46377.1 hypothetical protein EXE41_10235 [Halorubrum sp. SD690R]
MTRNPRSADESTKPWHDRQLAHWDESALYEAVTEAVSNATGTARSTVASRYDRAHAAALSRLFGEGDGEATPSTGVVKFVLSECVVSVHSSGRISASPADETPAADG